MVLYEHMIFTLFFLPLHVIWTTSHLLLFNYSFVVFPTFVKCWAIVVFSTFSKALISLVWTSTTKYIQVCSCSCKMREKCKKYFCQGLYTVFQTCLFLFVLDFFLGNKKWLEEDLTVKPWWDVSLCFLFPALYMWCWDFTVHTLGHF